MTKIFVTLAVVAFATFASTAHAHSPVASGFIASTEGADLSVSAADHPSLDTIVRNWSQYGFMPPVKPQQMRVNGRNGVSISGTDYAAAVAILRSGASEEGRSAFTGSMVRLWKHAGETATEALDR